MQKEFWQSATFVLAGVSVLMAATAFYNKRELARVSALLVNAENTSTHQAPAETHIVYEQLPATPPSITYLESNQKCIAGTVMEKSGNAWRNVGTC